MSFAFHSFLSNLHRYQHFTDQELRELLDEKVLKVLKDSGLIKRSHDEKTVLCRSCDDPHSLPVKKDGDEIYCFCPESDEDRNLIEEQELATWLFNVPAFLQEMAIKLGIDGQIEPLATQGMWQVGGFTKDDTRYNCYFFCGKDFIKALEFIKGRPKSFYRYVVITSEEEFETLEMGHELLLIQLPHMVQIDRLKVNFNKKTFDAQIAAGFRVVDFKAKNGQLLVNGKRLVTVALSTPEYHFIACLWKNFNVLQTHDSLINFIFKKTGQTFSDMPGKTCHKLKTKIKKNSEIPELVDIIFKSMKNEDGKNCYIMRNP